MQQKQEPREKLQEPQEKLRRNLEVQEMTLKVQMELQEELSRQLQLQNEQQHELLLPERWTRPEADINGIVLLLDGDFGKGKFNLALPFADATSDNFNSVPSTLLLNTIFSNSEPV